MATRQQIHQDGTPHNPREETLEMVRQRPNYKYSDLFWTDLTRGEWNYWTKKLASEGVLTWKWCGRGCYAWRGYKLAEGESINESTKK